MTSVGFLYPPSPQILHWLSAGQLSNRIQRTIRLWVLLNQLYGVEPNWAGNLPQPFNYPDIRVRLFSRTHGQPDSLSAEQLTQNCSDPTCICHTPIRFWLSDSNPPLAESQWLAEMAQLTGIAPVDLGPLLDQPPFAIVHRSVRDDLKLLSELGWLIKESQGRYRCPAASQLPTPPAAILPTPTSIISSLSPTQSWELLQALEAISFVQPNLQVIVQSLWEQMTYTTNSAKRAIKEPTQRIFIHLDYILPPEKQDQVDDLQEQIEQLWRTPDGGVIQFDTWLAKEEQKVKVTVYPVCLHYLRRAKYLSAYGIDPTGKIAWHNYRLDRIASKQLKILAWGDPEVPKELKELWKAGELPSPEYVQSELDAAWGFNFYLPRQLLLLRFPRKFAKWYVDNTVRHPTFRKIPFKQIPSLICREIGNTEESHQILEILKTRSPKDAYYCAWIRDGDINVIMRLRDWRPNGEVIAPIFLRQSIAEEVKQEAANYREI